ncbi:uncharacterized protein L201_004417 [Kwoniella dendrophila CBS 6074]|uniref:Uncharacterized protein n=1 Tax=Kwoniella dendrophila CBS 6074 TaxID=1295534 RepID=A0AAX4JX82_9TREE
MGNIISPSKPITPTIIIPDTSGNPPPVGKYDKPNITYQGEQPKPTPWGQTSVYISSPRPAPNGNQSSGNNNGRQGK